MKNIYDLEFVRINDFVDCDDKDIKEQEKKLKILLSKLKECIKDDVKEIVKHNEQIISLIKEQEKIEKLMYKKASNFFDENGIYGIDLSYVYELAIDNKKDLELFCSVNIFEDEANVSL